MNLRFVSLAGYFILATAVVILVLEHSILADGYPLLGIQCLAVALMVWARITFGRRSFHASADPTAGGLMTAGPYRFIRHPIYASVLYFVWAAVLSHLSAVNFLCGMVGTLGVAIRVYAEEKLLLDRYPEYAGYAARTSRFVPFLF